jgi:hypothetical protein
LIAFAVPAKSERARRGEFAGFAIVQRLNGEADFRRGEDTGANLTACSSTRAK